MKPWYLRRAVVVKIAAAVTTVMDLIIPLTVGWPDGQTFAAAHAAVAALFGPWFTLLTETPKGS